MSEGQAANETPPIKNPMENRAYLFRGDDNYRGGPVGNSLGADADAADIQNAADHVLRKQSRLTSRFTSFSTETVIAKKFTSSRDEKFVYKVAITALHHLEAQGVIKLWDSAMVHTALEALPRKLARQAADVRAAMQRNREILVEGQIPAALLEPLQ